MDVQNVNNQKCFVSTLSRLRESSKDAVASADSSFADPYSSYMHVDRPVQDKFVELLQKTYNSDHAELILLCGSVGDGKSHMLSYCKEKYPDMMSKFYVHNDSTASLYIDKPAAYTLLTIMESFTDDKIEQSKEKVILAINLGTLNNFLEADKDNRFSRLKKYVEAAGILDESMAPPIEEKFFHNVNFADYHIYELAPFGVDSTYIRGLLNKIVSETEDNIYFSEYSKLCTCCEAAANCPVKANFELLKNAEIQQGIIAAVIENIVKNKLIVSTRSLLNMIYEILVDERYWDRGSLEPRKEPTKLSSKAYCEALLPNVLFEKRNASEVLDLMNTVDPMQIRNEEIDDFFVYYENTDDVIDIFSNNLPIYKSLISRVQNENFADASMHEVKEALLKLFVRTCWLTENRSDLLPKDSDYEEYMRALYAWNVGDYASLNNVFNVIEKGVLAWNGYAEKNEMQLALNNKLQRYHLIQSIKIKPTSGGGYKQAPGSLSEFRDELKLRYKYSDNKEAELDVDFALFKLLKRVKNGYVPSINDKRVNVKCVEFINRISNGGSKMEELLIRDMSQKEFKQYRLSFSDICGYVFEVD